jgi:hypothetical protein
MIQYENDSTVRVVDPNGTPVPLARSTTRTSHADRILAENLDAAEHCFRDALVLVVEGLDILGLFTLPQHRNLPTLLTQQIEQVVEYRRVRL